MNRSWGYICTMTEENQPVPMHQWEENACTQVKMLKLKIQIEEQMIIDID
jgi:hypothetical protein